MGEVCSKPRSIFWQAALTLLLLLTLLSASSMAQAAEPSYTYTIYRDGSTYAAVNDGEGADSFSTEGHVNVSQVMAEIDGQRLQADASYAPCHLILGSGGSLNIGTSALTLQNGEYTVTGSVTGSISGDSGCVVVSGSANVTLNGDIDNTCASGAPGNALVHTGSGTVTVLGGCIQLSVKTNINRLRAAINNYGSGTVRISGGEILSADQKATALLNVSSGTVVVTGGYISSAGNPSTSLIYGNTVLNYGSGLIQLSGGLLENTGSGCVVSVNSGQSRLRVDGSAVLYAAKNYAVDNYTGTLTFSGHPSLAGHPSQALVGSGALGDVITQKPLLDEDYIGGHLSVYYDGSPTAGTTMVRGGGDNGGRWSLVNDAATRRLLPGGAEEADLVIAARPVIAPAYHYTILGRSDGTYSVTNAAATYSYDAGTVRDALSKLEENRNGADCQISFNSQEAPGLLQLPAGETLSLIEGYYLLDGGLQGSGGDLLQISGDAEVLSLAILSVAGQDSAATALRLTGGSFEALAQCQLSAQAGNYSAQAAHVESGSLIWNGGSLTVSSIAPASVLGVETTGALAFFRLLAGTVTASGGNATALSQQAGQVEIAGGSLSAFSGGSLLATMPDTETRISGGLCQTDNASRGLELRGSGFFTAGRYQDNGSDSRLLALNNAQAEISGGAWQSISDGSAIGVSNGGSLTVSGGWFTNRVGDLIAVGSSGSLSLRGGSLCAAGSVVDSDAAANHLALSGAPQLSGGNNELSTANAIDGGGYLGSELRVFATGDLSLITGDTAGLLLVTGATDTSLWTLTNENYYLKPGAEGLFLTYDNRLYSYTLTNHSGGYALRNGLGQTVGADGQTILAVGNALASVAQLSPDGEPNQAWLYFGNGDTSLELSAANLSLQGNVDWRLSGAVTGNGSEALLTVTGKSQALITASLTNAGNGPALRFRGDGSLTVMGGSFSTVSGQALLNSGGGTLRVAGGSFSASGSGPAAQNTSTGSISIEGGTFTSTSGATLKNSGSGTLTVTGGTFNATSGVALWHSGSGSVVVSAGTFASVSSEALWNTGTGSITLSGGSFHSTNSTGLPTASNDGTGSALVLSGATLTAQSGPAVENNDGILTVSGGSLRTAADYAILNLSQTSGSLVLSGSGADISGALGQLCSAAPLTYSAYSGSDGFTLYFTGLVTDSGTVVAEGIANLSLLTLLNPGANLTADAANNRLLALDPDYSRTYVVTNYNSGYMVQQAGERIGWDGQPLATALSNINTHRAGNAAILELGGPGVLKIGNSSLLLSTSAYSNLTIRGKLLGSGTPDYGLIYGNAANNLVLQAEVTATDSYPALYLFSGSATVESGSISGWLSNKNGRITVSGGSVTSSARACISLSGSGTVTVSGGSLSNTASSVEENNAVILVTGSQAAAAVTVSGGTLTSATGNGVLLQQAGPTLTLDNAPIFTCAGSELVLSNALVDEGYQGQRLTLAWGGALNSIWDGNDPAAAPVVVAGGGANLSRYQLDTWLYGSHQLPNHLLQVRGDDLVGLVNPALDEDEYAVTYLYSGNDYGLISGYSILNIFGQRVAFGNDYSSFNNLITILDSQRLEPGNSYRPVSLYFYNSKDSSAALEIMAPITLSKGDYTVTGKLTSNKLVNNMILNVTGAGSVTLNAELTNPSAASVNPCVSYSGSGILTVAGGSIRSTGTGNAAIMLPASATGRLLINSGLLSTEAPHSVPVRNLSEIATVALGQTAPPPGSTADPGSPLLLSHSEVAVYTKSPVEDANYVGPDLYFYYEGLTDGHLAVKNGANRTWKLANVRLALTEQGNDLYTQTDASAEGAFTYTVKADGETYQIWKRGQLLATSASLADVNYPADGVRYHINSDRLQFDNAYADCQILLSGAEGAPLALGSSCLTLSQGRIWLGGSASGAGIAKSGESIGLICVASGAQVFSSADLTSTSNYAALRVAGSMTLLSGTVANTNTSYGQAVILADNGSLTVAGEQAAVKAAADDQIHDTAAAIYSNGVNTRLNVEAGLVQMAGSSPAIYNIGVNSQVNLTGGSVENTCLSQQSQAFAVLGSGALRIDGASITCAAANTAVKWSCGSGGGVTIAQSDPAMPTLIQTGGLPLLLSNGMADVTALTMTGGTLSHTGANSAAGGALAFDSSFAGRVELNGGTLTSSSFYTLDTGNGTAEAVLCINGATLTNSYSDGSGKVLMLRHGGLTQISGGSVQAAGSGQAVFLPTTGNSANSRLLIDGGTVGNSGSGKAIENSSAALVTVGGGRVESAGECTICNGGSGLLTVSSGTVVNTGSGNAIYSTGSGSVTVTGGSVIGSDNNVLWHNSTGKITIEGGRISSSGSGNAIWNQANGEILVNGGTVSVSGSGCGIYNNAGGSITVRSGRVEVSATGSGYAIDNSGSGSLSVTGGTVENLNLQGLSAIFNHGHGSVTLSQPAAESPTSIRALGNVALENWGNGLVTISGGTLSGTYAVLTDKVGFNGSQILVSGSCQLKGTTASIKSDLPVMDNGYIGSDVILVEWDGVPAENTVIVTNGAANAAKWRLSGYGLVPGSGSNSSHLIFQNVVGCTVQVLTATGQGLTAAASAILRSEGHNDMTLTGSGGSFQGSQLPPDRYQVFFYANNGSLLGTASLALMQDGQSLRLLAVEFDGAYLFLAGDALLDAPDDAYRFLLAAYDGQSRLLSCQDCAGDLTSLTAADFQPHPSAAHYKLLALTAATLAPVSAPAEK